jgi:hypothetical protein
MLVEVKKKRNTSPNQIKALKPYQKGQSGNPAGKPKGAVSAKTKGWNLLQEAITTTLTDKFMQEMTKLEGAAFINAYLGVMEYFKPKLSRSEVRQENTNVEQVVINIPVSTEIPQFPSNFDEAEVIE